MESVGQYIRNLFNCRIEEVVMNKVILIFLVMFYPALSYADSTSALVKGSIIKADSGIIVAGQPCKFNGVVKTQSSKVFACSNLKWVDVPQGVDPRNFFYDVATKKTWDGSERWSPQVTIWVSFLGHTNGGWFGGGHSYCAHWFTEKLSYGIRSIGNGFEMSFKINGVQSPWKINTYSKYQADGRGNPLSITPPLGSSVRDVLQMHPVRPISNGSLGYPCSSETTASGSVDMYITSLRPY